MSPLRDRRGSRACLDKSIRLGMSSFRITLCEEGTSFAEELPHRWERGVMSVRKSKESPPRRGKRQSAGVGWALRERPTPAAFATTVAPAATPPTEEIFLGGAMHSHLCRY